MKNYRFYKLQRGDEVNWWLSDSQIGGMGDVGVTNGWGEREWEGEKGQEDEREDRWAEIKGGIVEVKGAQGGVKTREGRREGIQIIKTKHCKRQEKLKHLFQLR